MNWLMIQCRGCDARIIEEKLRRTLHQWEHMSGDMVVDLGLVNTRPAVNVFLVVLIYPLSIWMLRGVFEASPHDLIDAVAIDGASRITILTRVVIPAVTPCVGAVAIITFLWSWNEFMFPFLVLNFPNLYPITVGLFHFISDEGALSVPALSLRSYLVSYFSSLRRDILWKV